MNCDTILYNYEFIVKREIFVIFSDKYKLPIGYYPAEKRSKNLKKPIDTHKNLIYTMDTIK